jgi:hypothetical protein
MVTIKKNLKKIFTSGLLMFFKFSFSAVDLTEDKLQFVIDFVNQCNSANKSITIGKSHINSFNDLIGLSKDLQDKTKQQIKNDEVLCQKAQQILKSKEAIINSSLGSFWIRNKTKIVAGLSIITTLGLIQLFKLFNKKQCDECEDYYYDDFDDNFEEGRYYC